MFCLIKKKEGLSVCAIKHKAFPSWNFRCYAIRADRHRTARHNRTLVYFSVNFCYLIKIRIYLFFFFFCDCVKIEIFKRLSTWWQNQPKLTSTFAWWLVNWSILTPWHKWFRRNRTFDNFLKSRKQIKILDCMTIAFSLKITVPKKKKKKKKKMTNGKLT